MKFWSFQASDPRSSSNERASKTLEETVHDGERYQVGMLWATDEPLPDNYFAALVQLKSVENRLEKDPELKAIYQKTRWQWPCPWLFRWSTCLWCYKSFQPWEVPTPPSGSKSTQARKRTRVLNGAAKCHKQSLNSDLLTGPDLLQNLLHDFIRFSPISLRSICRHRSDNFASGSLAFRSTVTSIFLVFILGIWRLSG